MKSRSLVSSFYCTRGSSSHLRARPSRPTRIGTPPSGASVGKPPAAVSDCGPGPVWRPEVAPPCCRPHKDPQSARRVPRPSVHTQERRGQAFSSPLLGWRGCGRDLALPSPSARRQWRVGVAQSALRSLWQPRVDKGRPHRQKKRGWVWGSRAAGRPFAIFLGSSANPCSPPRNQISGIQGVFLLSGKDP